MHSWCIHDLVVCTHRIIDFYREKVAHFIIVIILMSYPFVWLLLLDSVYRYMHVIYMYIYIPIYIIVTFTSGRKSLISRHTYYFLFFYYPLDENEPCQDTSIPFIYAQNTGIFTVLYNTMTPKYYSSMSYELLMRNIT